MRILATGDNHFSEHSSRWSECLKAHKWMVDVVQHQNIDLFLDGGDIYDGPSTPIDRQAVAEWIMDIGSLCPIVIAKGNHDIHRDCELLSKLKTMWPIVVEERAGVHLVQTTDGEVAIGAMAWPERGVVLASQSEAVLTQAQLERQHGRENVENLAREAMRDVLRGLGSAMSDFDRNIPRILLGHFMVDGSMTSTGQPLIGSPMNVSLDDLALAGAQLGIMGHIHMEQVFDVRGAPHHYTGSPFRTDFGQLERKGVLIAEFDDDTGQLLTTEFLESPCARMQHVELRWGEQGFNDTDGNPWPGVFGDLANTELRLRYHVPVDQREAADRKANEIVDAMRQAGAISVKVEPRVKPQTRARAPEVAQAYAIREKLLAYWNSIDFEPGARRESLLAKSVELEDQVRNESKGDTHASA